VFYDVFHSEYGITSHSTTLLFDFIKDSWQDSIISLIQNSGCYDFPRKLSDYTHSQFIKPSYLLPGILYAFLHNNEGSNYFNIVLNKFSFFPSFLILFFINFFFFSLIYHPFQFCYFSIRMFEKRDYQKSQENFECHPTSYG
jgi:hypothetical protein